VQITLPKPLKGYVFTLLSAWLFFLSCQPEPVKIVESYPCDAISSEGVCTEKPTQDRLYSYSIHKDKKIDTWEKLSGYSYFKTKETPGVFLKFTRKFTITERKQIKDTLLVFYEFSTSRGKVEGIEVGEDWLFVFQYFGDILKTHAKELGEQDSLPKLEKVFPTKLKFFIESDLFKIEVENSIDMKLDIFK